MLADKFILSLENVELNRKHLLPDCSGIYYVIDLEKTIWYIGRLIRSQSQMEWRKNTSSIRAIIISCCSKKNDFSYLLQSNQSQEN